MEDVVILGSGAAGLTAAIYAARANLNPLVLHGDLMRGQLTTTSEVENFPGFENGISGPDLMMTMEKQALRFGARIELGFVAEADFSGDTHKLGVKEHRDLDDIGRTIETRTVIIATGASPRKLGVPGEEEFFGVGGVSSCATCDGAFTKDQVVTVVGGGDSAMEEAHFLTRYASKVYVAHRRDEFRASKIMQERVLNHPGIEVLWNTVVDEVYGETEPRKLVKGLKLTNRETGEQRDLASDWMFLAIGHIPNSQPFAHALETDENGYLVTDQTKTKVPGVFAAGDVQDHVYRQAITAAGTGCMAALEAERYLG